MKTILTLFAFFTIGLVFANTDLDLNDENNPKNSHIENILSPKNNDAFLKAKVTVGVDCDGDGKADYVGTVDAEYKQDLIDQFKASCN